MIYRLSAEERWDRIAKVLLVFGAILVGASVYGLATGDDARGALMTAAPGALLLGVGWLAARKRDRIIYGTPPTPIDWVSRVASSIAVILVVIGIFVRGSEREHNRQEIENHVLDDVEIGEVPGPNGTMLKSLVPKYHRSACPDWFIPDPDPADRSDPMGRCAPPP